MDSSAKTKRNSQVIQEAAEVLRIEAEGILHLIDRLDQHFADMVDLIYHTTGRVIVAGIGKSGIIGRKIVATLNSTGTRSLFLHPVEAMHGDLGMVSKHDVFLALSNSGETDELNILIPSIKSLGCKVVTLTANTSSTLAQCSDIVVDVGVEKEACPLGLAPTASTTALLAMGDALAVVLINKNAFKLSDFKKFHPGGSLGHRLSTKVKDMMLTGSAVPRIPLGASMEAALKEIDRLEIGATLVITKEGILAGIITDGDIRRLVAGKSEIFSLPVSEVMTRDPRTLGLESLAFDALNLMEKYQITVLPITNDAGEIQGILHLHDILGKGQFKFNGN